jgi:hypothetical protein
LSGDIYDAYERLIDMDKLIVLSIDQQ